MAGSQLADAVLGVLQDSDAPMVLEAISAKLPKIDVKTILTTLSDLVNKYFVKTTTIHTDASPNGTLQFSLISEPDRRKFESLDRNSVIVYRLIEEKGGSGIWRKDIKSKTKLPEQELTKIINLLSGKQLIRELKSPATKNKKTYIIFELSATGDHASDIWAADKSEFDPLMVHEASAKLYQHVRQNHLVALSALEAAFVGNAGIMRNAKALSQKHVHQVLETLKHDGLIEMLDDSAGAERFIKLSRHPHPANHLTEVPCGKCPVYDSCGDVGDVTPVSCPYFQRWLDF